MTAYLAATLTALALAPADIEWSPAYDQAVARAASEGRVLFVAVHMPGERANERMAKDVYTDKAITQLAGRTVNLLAMSMDHYRELGTRLALGGLDEERLQRLDIDLRAKVLKPDDQGFVVAPQHVFLRPDGEVILSVPYELTAGELEWCFLQALATVDAEGAPKPSKRARPPKRLLKGEVIEGSDESIGATAATLEEVRELIREINKGAREGRWEAQMRILTADEEEARDFITKELRAGGRRSDENKAGMILNIQRRSPASWWSVVIEFAEHNAPEVREEVAACLEVLAAPESLKDIKRVLGKERDPRLEGMWLRAYASAGADDPKVRKAVLKEAQKSRDPVTRANAVLALGYLVPGEDLSAFLRDLVQDEQAQGDLRMAAICAMAMTRDSAWTELLSPLATQEGPTQAAAAAALRTLDKGDLTPLGPSVKRACKDVVNRERTFGVVRS